MLWSEEQALTVSQLNGYIRDVINMGFPQAVWVCGEIQGFNRNRGKPHVFFELCEKDPVSKDILARAGLVIFANRKAFIDDILQNAANAFELKDDIEVKFLCKVDFYPPHGAMRLIVESIDPTYTLGKIAQEKQRLIALLREKGVLERNKILELPLVPLKIGLITAYDSAAYNDFISELSLSRFGFKVFCRNSLTQGKGTEADVCRALTMFNRESEADIIVITRGGGSVADLSCFDSQAIAEKIAQSRIPVLSGIGHEINITITDLAAHTFAKTPTAIAQFIVNRVAVFLADLLQKREHVLRRAQERLDDQHKQLHEIAAKLQVDSRAFLFGHRQTLSFKTQTLQKASWQLLSLQKNWAENQGRLLSREVLDFFDRTQAKMKGYERLVAAVHPSNTLKRGFSITRDAKGKLLYSVQAVPLSATMETTLADGTILSEVRKKIE